MGPLQPVAVAVITDVPDHAAVKVTAPVAGTMLFPAAVLVPSSEYVMPVLVVAVAE